MTGVTTSILSTSVLMLSTENWGYWRDWATLDDGSFRRKALAENAPNPVTPGLYFWSHVVFLAMEALLLLLLVLAARSRQPTCRARRAYFCMCAGAFAVGFVVLRVACRPMKFSRLWVSDCSEYAAADRARLEASGGVFDKVARDLQAPRHSHTAGALGTIHVAINSIPREQQYLTQTLASLLGGLSLEELWQLERIEILADKPTIEFEGLAALQGLRPLVRAIYNPEARQTPLHSIAGSARNGSTLKHSWITGSILHYVHALERCALSNASSCLVLDDDTVATTHWVTLANRGAIEISRHQQAHRNEAGHAWTMIKLFQPVWANKRQSWSSKPGTLLLLSALLGGLPGWILGRCCGQQPSAYGPAEQDERAQDKRRHDCAQRTCDAPIWALTGMVWALFCLWVLSAANVDWLAGDAFVHPYGTCHMAQANLFNMKAVEAAGLRPYLLDRAQSLTQSREAIDLLICEFFTKVRPLFGPMWATSPALFQHVGLHTSLATKASTGCRTSIFHEGVWKP